MDMNGGSKFGMVLGGLGGIVALIGLVIYYASETEKVAPLALLLLVACMFFALCGAFSKNGQWTSKALTFYGFLVAAVCAAITIVDYVDVIFGVIEIIIAALVILVSYSPNTIRFVNKN